MVSSLIAISNTCYGTVSLPELNAEGNWSKTQQPSPWVWELG